MKKLIYLFAFLFVLALIPAEAQNFTINTVGVTVLASDSITDTEARDTTVLIKLAPGNQPYGYSVHVAATAGTGTVDIDVNYQTSNDGVSWFTHTSDSIAAGNLTYIHEDINGVGARYIRVLRTGVGTQLTGSKVVLYVFRVPD